jgi:hypothetical protein
MNNSKTPTIEMTLGEDSVIKKIYETGEVGELKAVETDFSDTEYNEMMTNFLNKMRLQAQQPQQTNKEKVKSIREQLADNRRPLKFRKGFLNTNHTSVG